MIGSAPPDRRAKRQRLPGIRGRRLSWLRRTGGEAEPARGRGANRTPGATPRGPSRRILDPHPASGLTDNPREWANALGAGLHIGPLGAYHGSVVDGKRWLRDFIPRELRTCPAIKLVLVGYSRGAQVTGDVSSAKSPGRRSTTSRPSCSTATRTSTLATEVPDRGSYDHHRSGALGKRRSFGGDPRVRSFCHHHDPVCQANRQPAAFDIWRFKQHENYPPDARQAASRL